MAPATSDGEIPEGDAVEQQLEVRPVDDAPVSADLEAPDADAYEQAQVVPVDEDDWV